MPDYAALQSTANKLIEQNGATFSIRRHVGGVLDPVLGELVGSSTEEQQVAAVVLPPRSAGVKGSPEKYEGVQNVLTNAIDLLISAVGLSWAPAPEQDIWHSGQWWRIRAVAALNPDGATTVIFKAWAVRA